MPLYMDIHKFDEIVNIDDIKKAHQQDKSIQDEYNVKYHQFWVNQEAGMVFCLVEGPSKEACEWVHKNTHGFVACNIVEVEPGKFKLFMGDGLPVDHGLVYDGTGSVDPGYRHIIVVDIHAITSELRAEDYKNMRIPISAKNLLLDRIAQFNGRVVEKFADDNTVGIFNTAVNAIRCAKEIKHDLLDRKKSNVGNEEWNISFRIGLATGHPLTEDSGFFSQAINLARRLCLCAKENEALVSSLMTETTNLEDVTPFKPLSRFQESFINDLFSNTERNISSNNFNVDSLSHALAISRPQLYRKIMSLTGRTPIDFISALRMSKALSLMKNNFGNVSEVALEVGYSNPSYFSKCFQKNYGCTPSEFIKIQGTP